MVALTKKQKIENVKKQILCEKRTISSAKFNIKRLQTERKVLLKERRELKKKPDSRIIRQKLVVVNNELNLNSNDKKAFKRDMESGEKKIKRLKSILKSYEK